MSGRVISPVQTGYDYTSEQESAVRALYEALGRAQSMDRRILAAALAEAFMCGMTTQEQLCGSTQQQYA